MRVIAVILTLALLGSTYIVAKEANDEKQAATATEFRQSIFKLIRSNAGPIGGMARGNVAFDNDIVIKNATRINQLSQMIPDYFVINTSKFSVETEALAKIWDNKSDFEEKAGALQSASAALLETAQAGNEADTKKAIGAIFRTCKSCHDEYKKD